MIDQLIIGSKASYDDFGASMKERKVNLPEKKSIKDTVPFSNQTYDFSAIDGEVYWNERILEYVFEILADSPEQLEEKKQRFFNWIMNVMNEDIHDPYIKNYHFVGTYDSSDPDDSEVEKSTITVKFTAYPYMLADQKTTYDFEVATGQASDVVIENNSSHRIAPMITSDDTTTVKIDGETFIINEGSFVYDSLMLKVGTNALTLQNTTTAGTVTFEFIEEVL